LLDPNSEYSILRKDRVVSHGGGVAVFLARHLHFIEVTVDQSFADLELVCFDLLMPTCKLRFLSYIGHRTVTCLLLNMLIH